MLGILKRIEEGDRLDRLKRRLQPAEMRGVQYCVRCAFCCKVRTCIPLASEIPKIAKFLKIDVQTLIQKYMVVDRRNGSNFFLRWVASNIKDCVGGFIPWDRTYNEGDCIFLKDKNVCAIYPVRPKDAKTQRCWQNSLKEFNPIDHWKEKTIENFGFKTTELRQLEDGDIDED